MILSRYERMIIHRYLIPGRSEAFIALVAGFSLFAVMLGVASLIIVMSVMNGFRAELFDKITGLNGHAIIKASGGEIADWRSLISKARDIQGVVDVVPTVEKPLFVSLKGRVEPAIIRGIFVQNINKRSGLNGKEVIGSFKRLHPGTLRIAIGSRLAESLGATLGSEITIIDPKIEIDGPQFRSISYTVASIFEVGVYDFDDRYIVMPIEEAQQLLRIGDTVSAIEIKVRDPDKIDVFLSSLKPAIGHGVTISDWRQMNRELFNALSVDRIVSFTILSIILLVAAFNITSSLIMLVRSKTRDIAVLRTMGATQGGLMRIFVVVGTTIGALGVIAGGALSWLFITYRQQITWFIELITNARASDPQMRFLAELPIQTDVWEIAGVCALALGFSFLATLYPAWKASRTDPVQVLRYE